MQARSGASGVNYGDGTITREVAGPAVRVDDGAWHHVVVLFDRDTGIIVYVDVTNFRTNLVGITGSVSNSGAMNIGKSAATTTSRKPRRGGALRFACSHPSGSPLTTKPGSGSSGSFNPAGS